MNHRRSTFGTWMILALAIALAIGAGGWLGYHLDTRPVREVPGPTATVTEPGPTVTKQAPRRPERTVRETVKVPGPTVTVTETVTVQTPGPTVTVTETTTETATPLPINPGPMVLNVDTGVDSGWQVTRAARIWNQLLGCEAFTTQIPAHPQRDQAIYWVSQVEPGSLMLGDDHVRALHTGSPVYTIQLDPKWNVEAFVPIHELGHALGLSHGDEAGSIMNVSDQDRTVPNAGDVSRALEIQQDMGRCAA